MYQFEVNGIHPAVRRPCVIDVSFTTIELDHSPLLLP